MKAMIFAAGKGTRLGALTDLRPKALVEVGGKPMLQHVIEKLKNFGITEIIINLHHLGDQIVEFLRSKHFFGLSIEFSREAELLDTGGGLREVESFFVGEKLFLVHNVDVYTDFDLGSMVRAHSESSLATLGVMNKPSDRNLLFTKAGMLAGWENVKDKRAKILSGDRKDLVPKGFSGVHLISDRIFSYLRGQAGAFSIITTYLEAVSVGEAIGAYSIDGSYWIDIGTPADLQGLRVKLESK